MIEKVFYNVFIFGTIISICISPLLIFLYQNKYKYKLKSIYKILILILLLLILPINCIDFSNIKGNFKTSKVIESVEPNVIVQMEPEIILETTNTIIEMNESINIKNDKLSNFTQFVPYLWISISVIFLSYNLILYTMCLYKGRKNYIETEVPEIEEKINKICKEIGVKKIFYAFSNNITTPMVIGIFKKRIILPLNIREVENYEMILMHEIVHIKSKDIECKFILLLINSIYWFNPIIYKFIDQVEEVLELKCDEIVLENQPQIYKIKYAQVLLNQIEENRNFKYKFSLNFANKRRNIMKRFSNIVDKNKKKNMIGISCITASVIIISSAIIVSFPNINFAAIQEELEEIEVADISINQEDNINGEMINDLVEQEIIEDGNTVNENSLETSEKESTNENTITEENAAVEESKETTEVDGRNFAQNTGDVKKLSVACIPEMIFPLDNYYEITSRFSGPYNHTGIDIHADDGAEIKAAASGTVVYSGYKGSYGNLVIIDHGNEFQTYYAHCKDLIVEINEQVEIGDVIATVGSTGNSTGPHLHFETRNKKIAVNPENILNKFNAIK